VAMNAGRLPHWVITDFIYIHLYLCTYTCTYVHMPVKVFVPELSLCQKFYVEYGFFA
jgi:hypothetical protein